MGSSIPAARTSSSERGRSAAAGAIRAIKTHERAVAFICALATAIVAFEPRIRVGGLAADDWALYAEIKFPVATGYHSSFDALLSSAGSRIGAVPYWWASFSIFGSSTKLYFVTAAALAVLMAFSIYLLMRELRFSVGVALATMTLTLVAPSVETARFWFTPSGSQLSLALYFLGLTVALRAFDAAHGRERRLHLVSWLLYLASALYAEVALPLVAVAILVYVTRAPLGRSLRRWAIDIPLVIGGYLATSSFVGEHKAFGKLPASMWGEHARLLGNQALSIFTKMLVPFTETRALVLWGIVAVLVAAAITWGRSATPAPTKRALKQWSYVLAACAVSIIAIYATYVPAMLYYEPLGSGLASHINIPIAAPLAAGVIAVLMLARTVLAEVFGHISPQLVNASLAAVIAWLAVVAVYGVVAVRANGRIWSVAASRDYHMLHVLTTALPRPAANSTIYTFNEEGTVAPGLPVFFSSFELTNAIKIAYNRGDVSGYPVVEDDDTVECGRNGVRAMVGSVALNAPSPYRRSYFFDVASQSHVLISSRASCIAGLRNFPVGPYTASSLEWRR
jgi:hypothetical protein